jgi:Uri superfamily endonuclease
VGIASFRLGAMRDELQIRAPALSEQDSAPWPRTPGAYALILRAERGLVLDIPRFRGRQLAPGLYVYFGSARGPGGLAARVGRHLRGARRTHWHIDRLLAKGEVVTALVAPGGRECDWRAAVQAADDRVHVPLRGFGSSDCRACPAHLLALPDIGSVATVRARAPGTGLAGAPDAPR